MTPITPTPFDVATIWHGGPLPAVGQRITIDGRAVVLVAKQNHNKAGTPIMYREVRL